MQGRRKHLNQERRSDVTWPRKDCHIVRAQGSRGDNLVAVRSLGVVLASSQKYYLLCDISEVFGDKRSIPRTQFEWLSLICATSLEDVC